MSNSELSDALAIASVVGALVAAWLVVRLPSLDAPRARTRVRAAVIVCAALGVAAVAAASLGGDSMSLLLARVAELERERERLARELTTRDEQRVSEQRALDKKIDAKLADARAEFAHIAEAGYGRRADALTDELARTQLVVAEQRAFDRLAIHVLGEYAVGMETSVIRPLRILTRTSATWENAPQIEDTDWWVELTRATPGADKLKNVGAASLRVCLKGVRSLEGRFGHGGQSKHLFLVSEVIAVGDAAERACRYGPTHWRKYSVR